MHMHLNAIMAVSEMDLSDINKSYLCKGVRGAFNLKDVQDTIGSLQTTHQYSWKKAELI